MKRVKESDLTGVIFHFDNIICKNAVMHHSVSQFQAPPTIIALEGFYMFRLIKVKLKNVFMVINLFFFNQYHIFHFIIHF